MRHPRRPDGNMELACLRRGLRRGNFSHDRAILLPISARQARETAAPLGSLAALHRFLGSVCQCP
jgi:hypothetical protein